MKSLIASLLALCSAVAFAGSGGPDGFGYTWKDTTEPGGPAFQFIEPSVFAQTVLENNTAAVTTITLAQPWGGIYGAPVSQLRVSRNGFLSDDPTDTGSDETNDASLPATPSAGGGNRIYVLHDNLELNTTTGRVKYEYFAESPHPLHDCGVHVITWVDMQHTPASANQFSFQVLLFDNLDILMQFPAGNPEEGAGSTTGIQNAAATQGLTVYANVAGLPLKDTSVLISPPKLTVTTVADELNTPAGAAVSLREAVRDAPSGWRIVVPQLSFMYMDLSGPGGGQASRIDFSGKVLAVECTAGFVPLTITGGGSVRHAGIINGAWVSMENIRFEEGSNAGNGGSMVVEGASTLVTSRCDWLDNFANSDGGALLVTGGATARFNTGDFLRNGTNSSGGAISGKVNGKIIAENCRFWRNRAGDDGSGNGGAFALNSAVLSLFSCDLALNAAPNTGGAIVANVNSTVNARGCAFDHNRASNGGAFAAENAATVAGTPAIGVFERCTFYRNLALGSGGAVFENTTTNGGLMADLSFRYCTIIENSAGVSGGGFQLDDSSVEIAASILAYNRLPLLEDNVAASGGGSLDGSPGDNVESGNEAGFGAALGVSNAAPKLTGLGYFGGFARTCMLLKGSAGIDQVQVETFPAGFDARKLPAYRNGSGGSGPGLADAGAVERGQEYVVSSPDGNGASFAAALAAAHDGGTIVFNGVRTVSTGAVLGTSLPFAAGRTIFIEGPEDGGVHFPAFPLQLLAGQTLALHHATILYNSSIGAWISGTSRGRGGLTFSRCRFRADEPRYTGSSAVLVDGSRAAFLSCDLRGSLGTPTLASPTAMISVTGRDPALVVRDSRFSDIGSAAPSGSVIRAESGLVLLQNSSITGCRLWNGDPSQGAVRIEALDPHRAWLYAESCTISDTRLTRPTWINGPESGLISLYAGGPFDLDRSKAEAELVHVTLLCNEAADPGTATLSVAQIAPGRSRLTITNSLLAGTLPTMIGNGTFTSRGGNLCDYNPGFFGSGDIPNEDPELHPLSLGKNGTLHHAPRPGCPTIDAGLVRNVAAFDGRGGLRFLNGDGSGTSEPDVGAVESGRGIAVTTAVDENDGGLGLGAGNSLRECLAAAATFGGAVNVDASALPAVTLASGITVAGHQVEIDAGGLVLAKPAGGGAAITAGAGSLLAIHGVSFDSDDGALNCESDAAVTLENGGITGSALTAVTVRNDARALLSRLHVHRNAAAIAVLARDRSSLETADCTFADHPAGSTVVVQAQNFAWLTSRFTTFARNACSSGPLGLFGSSTGELHRCTLARNGRGIFHSGTSLLLFGDTVFSCQAGSGVIHSSGTDRITLGGNVCEHAVPEFNPAFGDLPNRDPFLGLLADDDGDGRPTMRPLARGPVFRKYIGATEPPRVITVTTSDDQNNTPAGSAVSLREAVRDIAPGGTVIFAPELNHAVFTLVNSSGQIAVTKSVTIDATALPKGIDIVGRIFSTTPGVALGLHGIHLRDHQAETGNGALLAMTDGTLVASHCTFSGGLISTGGLGGALWMSGCRTILENCTITGNQAGQAGAIRFEGGSAEIRHSTIARNLNTSAGGHALELGGGATLTVHGNAFFGNRSDNGAASAPDVSAGSVLSLGHNATSTALPGAVASDTTINLNSSFSSFADRGGLVDTLESSAPAARNTVPGLSNGSVPPPLTDARGFSRIRGAGTDWGANEHDGRSLDSDGDGLPDWWEDIYGFDSESVDDTTADADGDGATLLEEFQFLTDPFDDASALNFAFSYNTLVTPTVVLTWTSLPGFLYDVETSETLAGWSVANTQTGNGSVQLFQDPITGIDPPRKFYRLRIRD